MATPVSNAGVSLGITNPPGVGAASMTVVASIAGDPPLPANLAMLVLNFWFPGPIEPIG
jgi:hypothetical protein